MALQLDVSRYTHRVAIANQRLLSVANGVVRFAYRDSADNDQPKEMALPAPEFLRRFLLHVVPKGFMRIRHYGITANCQRTTQLERCREILAPPAAPPVAESATVAAADADAAIRCPACGGLMRVIEILAPTPAGYDTS